MYVSGRCHKDATPRVAPAYHAMPCHAAPCEAMRLLSYYAVGELLNKLSLTSSRPSPSSLALPTAFCCPERSPGARQDRRALAPPSPPATYLSYRRCCISTPLFRAAPTIHGHEQQACRRHRFSWSGVWRGEGLGVLWDVEVSRAVLFRCVRGIGGAMAVRGVSGSACLTGRRATSLPSRWAGNWRWLDGGHSVVRPRVRWTPPWGMCCLTHQPSRALFLFACSLSPYLLLLYLFEALILVLTP